MLLQEASKPESPVLVNTGAFSVSSGWLRRVSIRLGGFFNVSAALASLTLTYAVSDVFSQVRA